MKRILLLLIVCKTLFVQAQLKGEFTLGVLYSVDNTKYKLLSSSIQPVGVSAPTTLRFNKAGLRARAAVLKPINKTPVSILAQAGFNLRDKEILWFQKRYTYIHICSNTGRSQLSAPK